MIDARKYLANQLNGSIAKSLLNAADKAYLQYSEFFDYRRQFSLEDGKISSRDLDALGEVLAIPRPYLITGTDQTLLLAIADYPYPMTWKVAHGMANARSLTSGGGLLSSTSTEYTIQPVSDSVYIQFMRDSVTLRNAQSIEAIATVIEDLIAPALDDGADVNQWYSIKIVSDRANDIFVELAHAFTNYAPYMQMAFNATFTTAPRVFVGIGEF